MFSLSGQSASLHHPFTNYCNIPTISITLPIMKFLPLITLCVSAVVALEHIEVQAGKSEHNRRAPDDVTDTRSVEFIAGVGVPMVHRSVMSLRQVPVELVSTGLSTRVDARLKRQQNSTFYECSSAPGPAEADCKIVASQVSSSTTTLRIAPGACTTFSYQTCVAFFCSLCRTLRTTYKFIGNQLATAQTLCVEGGNAGSVVSERSPQWQAGFVHSGDALPNYDVISS